MRRPHSPLIKGTFDEARALLCYLIFLIVFVKGPFAWLDGQLPLGLMRSPLDVVALGQ